MGVILDYIPVYSYIKLESLGGDEFPWGCRLLPKHGRAHQIEFTAIVEKARGADF